MSTLRSQRFEIGRVVERTFGVIGRNFVPFSLLSLLLAGTPSAVSALLQARSLHDLAGLRPSTIAPFALVLVITILSNCILQPALTYGAVADLNGRRPGAVECLRAGVRVLLPVIGIALLLFLLASLVTSVAMIPALAVFMSGFRSPATLGLSMLAILVGVILILAGMGFLASMFVVAVPAEAVERPGVFGALRRSMALTRNNRWRIVGLFVLYVVAAMVAGMVFGMLIAVATGAALLASGAAPIAGIGLLGAVVNGIVAGLSTMVSSVGISVLYYELRAAKEGIGPEQLAAVFD